MKAQKEAGLESLSKKEQLVFTREIEKLEKDIGGIQDMGAARTPSSWWTWASTRSPLPKPRSWAFHFDRCGRYQPLARRH